MNRSRPRAATLAFGALVFLLVGSATAVVPEYSKVELIQRYFGCLGNCEEERTTLTQRGESAYISINAEWPRDSEMLRSQLPLPVYGKLWDSLVALRFIDLDTFYRGDPLGSGSCDGRLTLEFSTGRQTRSRAVSFRGRGGLPERFQQALLLMSGMRVWGELSVERLLDDTTDAAWKRLSDVLGWFFNPRSPVPEPVNYLVASNRSAEIVERIFDRAATASIGRDYVGDLRSDERARWLALFLPKDEAEVRKGLARPEAAARFLALGALQFGDLPDLESVAQRMTHDEALMVRLCAAMVLAYRDKLHDASVLLEGLQAGRPCLEAVIPAIVASGDSGVVDSLLNLALQGPPEVRQILLSGSISRKLRDPRVTRLLLLSFREARTGFDKVGVLELAGFRASDTALLDSVSRFLMTDTTTFNRGFAVDAMVRLEQYDRPRSLRSLREVLQKWPGNLQLVAALGEARDTALYAQLTEMATTGSPQLRAAAAYALAHFKTAEARKLMLTAIEAIPVDPYAVRAFSVWPDPRAYRRLVQVIGDTGSSWPARMWAVKALGKLRDKKAIPLLQSIADDTEEGQLSGIARDAIAEIKAPRTSGCRP
jgi:HEAT repeat protein